MPKISIKNIGPIKDAVFDLNKVNVFLGPQSSGKSTIAKIISSCLWIEKDVSIKQSLSDYLNSENFVKEQFEVFHKMKGYFNADSVLSYKSDVIDLEYSLGKLKIEWVDSYAYERSKISYIPSERNMVTVSELEKMEFQENNIRSFLFDWFDARQNYTSSDSKDLLDLGVKYYYSEDSKENHITSSNDAYDILLTNTSSGLQSITPLLIVFDYLTNWIYSNKENLSFEKDKIRRGTLTKLTENLILEPYYGSSTKDISERKTRIEGINKKIADKDLDVRDLVAKYISLESKLFDVSKSNIIIEEPEQNLFPKTQMDLVYHLLKGICNDKKRNHSITITTHSPYILYAINNCMLAELVSVKMQSIENKDLSIFPVSPKSVSVYQIKDGTLHNIQDKKDYLIGKNFFDDQMQDLMKEFYSMLNYYND